MKTLLLEIGTEEIPAGYIEPALTAAMDRLQQKLRDARIDFGASRILGTPRRLTLEVSDVAEKQARRHLILDKIIKQEALELTEEELDDSFERMAMGMNASVDAVKNYFKMDPKQLEYYKHTELEKKAVRIIIEKGEVTEVEPKSLEDDPTPDDAEEAKEE